MIIGESQKTLNSNDVVISSLPHPHRKTDAKFVFCNDNVMEVNRMAEHPSSWFIEDEVQQDGSLFMATPVDPLFVLIPLLELNRKKTADHAGLFCDLSQMLSDTNKSGYAHFSKFSAEALNLQLICDVNKDHDEPLYRLNDSKVTKWLRVKVDRLAESLASSDLVQTRLSGARASAFRRSTKDQQPTPTEDLLRHALGFLSEYVDAERIKVVADSYGITNFGVAKITAFDQFAYTPDKRKRDDADDEEDDPQTTPGSSKKDSAKKAKLTPGQAKLAKTNIRGMNKISAFFTPKKQPSDTTNNGSKS